MRIRAKRDTLERQIVDALRIRGVFVVRLSDPGLPDLICWKEGWVCLIALEVKSPRGRLTQAQQRYTGPRQIVRSVEEALAVFFRPLKLGGYAPIDWA